MAQLPFLKTPLASRWLKPWVLSGYLTDYQVDGINWAADRSWLAEWAPGSGKTLAGLAWLVAGGEDFFHIIVTRATTKQQWKGEAATYTELRPQILYGQTPTDIEKDTVILSWEILPYWIEALQHLVSEKQRAGKIVSVVFDEIHNAKAWRRREKYLTPEGFPKWREKRTNNGVLCRAAATTRLSRLAQRKCGLSATPIRNTIADLWAQLDYLHPGRWGTNWDFAHRYCAATQGKWGGLDTSGRSNIEELKAKLAYVIHRVSRAEMARQLPPKRRRLLYLSKQEQVRSVGFGKELKAAAKAGGTRLFELRRMEAAARKKKWILDTVLEDIEDGQKVVVFTGRRADAERLGKAVRKKLEKLEVPVFMGHGGISLTERHAMVEAYAKTNQPCVFIGTLDAFGEAIDGLQHTDHALIAMLPYTPGQVIQAEGRFSRHGSTRPVLITYVVAEGTVDEHISDLLLSKLDTVNLVMESKEAGDIAGTLQGKGNETEIRNSILAAMGGLL